MFSYQLHFLPQQLINAPLLPVFETVHQQYSMQSVVRIKGSLESKTEYAWIFPAVNSAFNYFKIFLYVIWPLEF